MPLARSGGAAVVQGLALPARIGIDGALHRRRCGIDAELCAAPQPAPRTRQEVHPHRRRSRENRFQQLFVNRHVLVAA